MSEKRGFKVGSGEDRFGDFTQMKGVTANVLNVKISAKDTGGMLTVLEQTGFTYKGGPPLHIHPNQDEFFYVLEGEYKFRVGDDKYMLSAGDIIFLPRNVPHAFCQMKEKGKMIVAFQPSGKMEEFFRKTAEWTSPPSPDEIKTVFEEHDMKIAGPPLNADEKE